MTVTHTPLVAMGYYAVTRKALRRRRRSGWLYVFGKRKKKITGKSPQKVQFQGKTWKSSCFIIRYYNVAYFIAWSKKTEVLHNPCLCTNNRLQSQQSEESHDELFGRKQESKVIKIRSALTKCNTPRDFVSYYWTFWNYCYNKQSYVFIFAFHFWVILGVKTCEVFLYNFL